MLHVNIICLGKLKEKYWREAETEYLKRLSAFAKVEIKELKEESFGEKNNPDEVRQKEALKIKSALVGRADSFIIALDEHGKPFSSILLASELNNLTNKQISNLTIIIGGPLGLHESILKSADLKISLSSLTFTHQMARVILLEQIYRAMMINNGRKYHY
ncbi:MAG: 23S rRNA (pseudouridine(1915)-N(3))-methyltransferase RlmH [Patescibacteria group bacterium]|nr:23S rRNA (pseudouridine(1915)-N(3))-methyltransferase RlmH [Patescibacteria group bacterium]